MLISNSSEILVSYIIKNEFDLSNEADSIFEIGVQNKYNLKILTNQHI